MSASTETSTLTASEIRRLRKASSVVLSSKWLNGELEGAVIRCYERDAEDNDYVSLVLPVRARFDFGGALLRTHSEVHAFEHIGSARFHDHWRTFLKHIRAGDELVITWNANGHRNSLAADAGLCVDEVSIAVKRGNSSGLYHVDMRVSLPNSARMFSGPNHQAIDGPNESW